MKCTVCGKQFDGIGVSHAGMCARCRNGKMHTNAKVLHAICTVQSKAGWTYQDVLTAIANAKR
jgi:hypothetical protein